MSGILAGFDQAQAHRATHGDQPCKEQPAAQGSASPPRTAAACADQLPTAAVTASSPNAQEATTAPATALSSQDALAIQGAVARNEIDRCVSPQASIGEALASPVAGQTGTGVPAVVRDTPRQRGASTPLSPSGGTADNVMEKAGSDEGLCLDIVDLCTDDDNLLARAATPCPVREIRGDASVQSLDGIGKDQDAGLDAGMQQSVAAHKGAPLLTRACCMTAVYNCSHPSHAMSP